MQSHLSGGVICVLRSNSSITFPSHPAQFSAVPSCVSPVRTPWVGEGPPPFCSIFLTVCISAESMSLYFHVLLPFIFHIPAIFCIFLPGFPEIPFFSNSLDLFASFLLIMCDFNVGAVVMQMSRRMFFLPIPNPAIEGCQFGRDIVGGCLEHWLSGENRVCLELCSDEDNLTIPAQQHLTPSRYTQIWSELASGFYLRPGIRFS